MVSNTYPPKPDWLTDEIIKSLKEDLKQCPNPYTDKDIDELLFDGDIDVRRANAHTAKQILEEYGLIND